MKSNFLLFIFFFTSLNIFGQIGFEDHVIIDNTFCSKSASSVYSTDIDGDGDMDLLFASAADDKIAWFENTDGLGNFGAQQIITTDAEVARSVFAADVDGDGDMDVLSASSWDSKIAWYENMDGSGNFGTPQIITTSAMWAVFVFAIDIDGDGDMDVLSASRDDNKIAWYENTDGLGNFGTPQIISTNAVGATSVFATDIDSDGDMDVLSSSSDDNKIAWYENMDGLGNFSVQQNISFSANGTTSVFAADIDSDGDMDVLSASADDNRIEWYENTNGAGVFDAPQIISSNADGARSVFAIDIDGDGNIDVLSASFLNDEIVWYKNENGLGSFGAPQILTTNAKEATSVLAADFDSDGDIDVLSASWKDDKIAWYKNMDGLGDFGTQQILTTCADHATSVFAADLDGDGDMDMLSSSLWDDKIAWYENMDGLGNFAAQKIIATNVGSASSVWSSDIDGDGDMDVVAISDSYNKIIWYENMDGFGNFGIEQIIANDALGGDLVSTSDLDGDGDMDIIASAYNFQFGFEAKIIWYENLNGQGAFGTQQIITSNGDSEIFHATGDIDSDGDMDIIAAISIENSIAWYENTDGFGNFGAQQIITTNAEYAAFVFTTDIDGDGDMDVLSASRDDKKIAWYENTDGFGNFGIQQVITTNANGANSVFAADVDDDGDMDVLSASSSDDKIAWYENVDGLGVFGTQQIISTNANGANSVFANDIDGDGDMDVFSSSINDDKIAWYENINLVSNKINGTLRLDINTNGCDSNDPVVSDMMVVTDNGSGSLSTFSLSNGFYQLFPNEGDFTTSIMSPNYYTSDPISHTSNFVGIGTTDIANFCLTPTQTINDLNITFLPTSQARPGFDATYQIVYHNVGTTQLDGNISIEFNDTKLDFLTATKPVTSQNNNVLTFTYNTLNPFETRIIDLKFNVLPPPITNIGDLLNFTATINPITGDFTENDNVFTFDQTVIGSYDPNDIRVLEGEEVLIADADKYLHYIIRFQNTGTADAINVRVENILDDKLDWNTIQLESSSHNNRVEIKNGNEVSFIFDEIYLPDSTTNESASHGFIAYKIKPKTDIAVGDIILNKADIFFDFNEAVETNIAMTEIVDPVSVDNLTDLNFSIYPIPTSGILSIQSKSEIVSIEIYDQMGQLILSSFNKNEIDISSLSRGFYFCKVKNEKGIVGIKKVIKE